MLTAIATAPSANAQQGVSYLYDDLGRLSKVVDVVSGQCAIYEYDAVGNILSITRQTHCLAAPTVINVNPGPKANCFLVNGQNLLGATVSSDLPGVAITDLRTTSSSVSFCLSTQAPVCSVSGTVTISTPGGSGTPLPFTISGARALSAGSVIAGSIDPMDETDSYCFSLSTPQRVILQGNSRALDTCVRVLEGETGPPVSGGLACGFPEVRLDLLLPAGAYTVSVSDNNHDQAGDYTLVFQSMVVADSVSEFSCTQGQNSWSYGYFDGPFDSSDFQPMTQCGPDTFFGGYPGNAWMVNPDLYWTSIRTAISFPNGPSSCGRQNVEHWAVRRWTSEVAGTVTISGAIANVLGGIDTFTGIILVDGDEVWRQTIFGAEEIPYVLQNVSVGVGSVIDFAVRPDGSDCNDHAKFAATISGPH
jgi:hypothetical protein